MELITPSGTLELVINLAEDEIRVYANGTSSAVPDRYAGAVFSGAYDRHFVIDTREHASIVGVHFKQGGAAAFLSMPADQLANRHVDLADLWSREEAARLRDRLCGARSALERFRLLGNALIGRMRRPGKPQMLVHSALDRMRPAPTSVRDVVSALGVSHRHFIEVFGREVGLPPKMYLRVQRFQRVLTMTSSTSAPPWPRVAQLCGYFDQAHLIRDFHAFTGLTPAQYVRRRSEHVKDNHLPIALDGSNISNTAGAQRSTLSARRLA
jgi:AraC-like DNA-binding protein